MQEPDHHFVSQLDWCDDTEPETFAPRYVVVIIVDVNQKLEQKFDLDYNAPFSSTC